MRESDLHNPYLISDPLGLWWATLVAVCLLLVPPVPDYPNHLARLASPCKPVGKQMLLRARPRR